MNNEALVLAVDIGTSSVRAMAFDIKGKILGRAQISYPTMRPRLYFEEQDPMLVRDSTYNAIAQLLSSGSIDRTRIAALSFSSQLYSVIALDNANNPLTNSILWSDGRSEAQASAMKEAHGPLWLYPTTGCPMNSIFPLAKLAWLREQRPEIFKSAKRFVSIKEFVTAPLIGEWAVDHSMASASGLFNISAHRWAPAALEALEIDDRTLSNPVSGMQGFSLAANSPLSDLGFSKDLRVFLGAGDGPLANIGSGASSIGAINIDLGTSGAARCIADAATTDNDASLWCFCLTESLWAYGGIVTNVGNSYQWLASVIADLSHTEIDEAYELLNKRIAETQAGSDGLLFMPYLRKARSPYWDERLRGTMYGLGPDHSIAHIGRALLEAVAYDLRTIIRLMDRRISTIPEILLTGGLSRSPIIPQLLADVLDREIIVPQQNEGSIAGAAILGFVGLGMIHEFKFARQTEPRRSFVPNGERRTLYQDYYHNYLRLVEALRSAQLP